MTGPSVHDIMRAAAELHGVTAAEFISEKRTQGLAHARQRAMVLARELTGASLPRLGRVFGGRDHTTVLYALRQVEARKAQSPEENKELLKLYLFFTAKLNAQAAPLHIPKLSC
jgi:chromosomal replication initiator protein